MKLKTSKLQFLNLILEAKENRLLMRKEIFTHKKISLSLTLNIPGYPKTNELITEFYNQILTELKNYLLANRIFITNASEKQIIDEAGNFYLVSIKNKNTSAQEIKKITELFETEHQLGRLIDIDISDKYGEMVSSGKQKLCFYCKKEPAIICMRNKSHTHVELRNFISKQINQYLKTIRREGIKNKLSSLAIKSLLYEISLTPKPGLVDFENSGSHTDMNFYSFINSTSAIAPYFSKIIEAAFIFVDKISINENKDEWKTVLPKIREIGLEMEKEMFLVTNNVNTQKGLIFLLGISLFAATFILEQLPETSKEPCSYKNIIKKICKGLTTNELGNATEYTTHGEKCYEKYGTNGAGIRYEVEQGLPIVFDFSLPFLKKLIDKSEGNSSEKFNFALKKTLLKIISVNNDTNILYRNNLELLNVFKIKAKEALNHKDFDEKYTELNEFCIKKNISPGGSADLLALTIFFYFYQTLPSSYRTLASQK